MRRVPPRRGARARARGQRLAGAGARPGSHHHAVRVQRRQRGKRDATRPAVEPRASDLRAAANDRVADARRCRCEEASAKTASRRSVELDGMRGREAAQHCPRSPRVDAEPSSRGRLRPAQRSRANARRSEGSTACQHRVVGGPPTGKRPSAVVIVAARAWNGRPVPVPCAPVRAPRPPGGGGARPSRRDNVAVPQRQRIGVRAPSSAVSVRTHDRTSRGGQRSSSRSLSASASPDSRRGAASATRSASGLSSLVLIARPRRRRPKKTFAKAEDGLAGRRRALAAPRPAPASLPADPRSARRRRTPAPSSDLGGARGVRISARRPRPPCIASAAPSSSPPRAASRGRRLRRRGAAAAPARCRVVRPPPTDAVRARRRGARTLLRL